MATLREYFDTDLKCLSVHADWEMHDNTGTTLAPVRAKIFQDFDANAKYWSFFIPEGVDVGSFANSIFELQETARCVLSSEGDTVFVQMGFSDYSERASSETLIFTKRIHLYIDALLDAKSRKHICELGAHNGFQVLVRDKEYALKRSQLQKPLAFISHDSRDKDSLVRNLALELSKLMCPVWYDEYSLQVGDSLRTSIETGLKETEKCIVVLSPNFLSNNGWGMAEFDSVFTREILEKSNVFLPVWHNVGVHEVYQYSPRLADKVGLVSSLGVEELAKRLANAIKQSGG